MSTQESMPGLSGRQTSPMVLLVLCSAQATSRQLLLCVAHSLFLPLQVSGAVGGAAWAAGFGEADVVLQASETQFVAVNSAAFQLSKVCWARGGTCSAMHTSKPCGLTGRRTEVQYTAILPVLSSQCCLWCILDCTSCAVCSCAEYQLLACQLLQEGIIRIDFDFSDGTTVALAPTEIFTAHPHRSLLRSVLPVRPLCNAYRITSPSFPHLTICKHGTSKRSGMH